MRLCLGLMMGSTEDLSLCLGCGECSEVGSGSDLVESYRV